MVNNVCLQFNQNPIPGRFSMASLFLSRLTYNEAKLDYTY